MNEGLVEAISDLISKEVSKLPPEIVSGNKMVSPILRSFTTNEGEIAASF